MPLLPKDYEAPKMGGGLYTKFEEGETEIMICDTAIFGYEYWNTDNRPVRSKEHPVRPTDIKLDGDGNPQRVKFFWAMPVWNVTTESFQVMELTQQTIQTELEYLEQSDKWPDPVMGFTISINRKGKDLTTEYNVQGNPVGDSTKAVVAQATEAYEAAKKNGFDITRLYDGGDPFKGEVKESDIESPF